MKEIILKNITKTIDNETVIDNVSMKLTAGSCYGLVGQNGSGKTMLIRLLAGLIKPTSGEYLCDDIRIEYGKKIPFTIGIIIENSGMYQNMSCAENLKILTNIRGKRSNEEITGAIKRVGLNPDNTKKIRKYSLGMRQRAIMAQAIIEKPEVLLLDEPMNGMDAAGVVLFRQIINEEKERGTLIIISSHIEEDINLLCDTVFDVENGKFTERK